MRSLALAVTLGLIAMVALSSAVLAGSQRPFKASFTATGVDVAPRCGANALTLGFAISGTATHTGRFTATGSNCTEFTLLTEAVDIWGGIIVLTAADGSTMTFSSVGSQDAPRGVLGHGVVEDAITGWPALVNDCMAADLPCEWGIAVWSEPYLVLVEIDARRDVTPQAARSFVEAVLQEMRRLHD